jgi:hypothetical protein
LLKLFVCFRVFGCLQEALTTISLICFLLLLRFHLCCQKSPIPLHFTLFYHYSHCMSVRVFFLVEHVFATDTHSIFRGRWTLRRIKSCCSSS